MPNPLLISASAQDINPSTADSPSTVTIQSNQETGNHLSFKRPKPNTGDDSFERTHRLANSVNQYFSIGDTGSATERLIPSINSPKSSQASRRPSFPPFRLLLNDNAKLSELTIMKHINRCCKTTITYGRYSTTGKKNTFLIYANSAEQFESLMNQKDWPSTIDNATVSVIRPTKIPTTCSIIVVGIPPQWDLTEFERDVKTQYPTLLKVERIFVRNGIPISKVRIDFSSYEVVKEILKEKRLLLDGDNMAFQVLKYVPPVKVLRCFICQQYNSHTASNCPNKENPVCFRCGQHHKYDPDCSKPICCANCKQDHMAGSPNCSMKIEARKMRTAIANPNSSTKPAQGGKRTQQQTSAWSNNSNISTADKLFNTESSNKHESMMRTQQLTASECIAIGSKIDLLLNKIDMLVNEQINVKKTISTIENNLTDCRNNISSTQNFIVHQICPLILILCNVIQNKNVARNKTKLADLLLKLHESIQQIQSNNLSDSGESEDPNEDPMNEPSS